MILYRFPNKFVFISVCLPFRAIYESVIQIDRQILYYLLVDETEYYVFIGSDYIIDEIFEMVTYDGLTLSLYLIPYPVIVTCGYPSPLSSQIKNNLEKYNRKVVLWCG